MAFPESEPDARNSLGDLLAEAARRLRRAGLPRPRLEAELLLGGLVGKTRTQLLTADRQPAPADLERHLDQRVEARLAGAPLQYLTGVQEFRSLAFHVDGRVLIPRPETEGAVEACLEIRSGSSPQIADIGTGSGCIAISLARELPAASIYGIDRSADALDLARVNACRLEATSVAWLEGDLVEPLVSRRIVADIIVSNPPYIAEHERAGLPRDVRDHEPQEALIAGPSGLEVIRRLIDESPQALRPGGALVLEIGAGQWDAVRGLFQADPRYDEPEVRLDFQKIPRIVVCRRRKDAGGRS